MPEVEDLLERADETLGDAKKAFREEMTPATVQNRLYYSIYYAAKAALLSMGKEPGAHEGVKILVGKELVGNNLIQRKWGRFFSQQQTYREKSDYEVDFKLEPADLEDNLEKAEKFISKMKMVVEENG